MSADRFIDNLARALAEPMPRLRAVRVLGASFAALAIPGVSSRFARAAAGTARQRTVIARPGRKGACPIDGQRWLECRDKTCCPSPNVCCSDIGGRGICCLAHSHCCANVCCDPAKFKCVITNSGRNGQCEPKRCGPDISDALNEAVFRTKAAFAGWSSAQRLVACDSLITPPIAGIGWEVNQLGPGGREQLAKKFQPECATCTKGATVQIGTGCHYPGSANYVIYGVMMRLCRDAFGSSIFRRSHFSEDTMGTLITMYKSLRSAPNIDESLAWARVGYRGWPNASTPPAELPNCATSCGKQFTGRLTVRWLPLRREI